MKDIRSDLLDTYTADAIVRLVADDSGNIAEMMKEFREKEQSYKLEFAYLRSQELWRDFGDDDLKFEFENLISKIKKRAISTQLNSLVYDIKEAEIKKDKDKITELVARFGRLTKELAQIQKI